jgi:hypothetical protein
MNIYDESGGYSAAEVTIDGVTRYEIRHYGGPSVHRFWQSVDDGQPAGPLHEHRDGPLWIDSLAADNDREPVAPRILRPILWQWILDDDAGEQCEELRETFGTGAYDAFRYRFAAFLATAGAAERSISDEARIVCERDYMDDGDGMASFDTDDERGAASILWNLAGKECARCGDDAEHAGEPIAFRSPVYVYDAAPLCGACAVRVAELWDERGDR